MGIVTSIVAIIVGLALVLFFAERLVKATAGLAAAFRVSAFLLSGVFLGFDPETLAVGVVGAVEGAGGIALGSVVGAAMVAVALAFGITAMIAPMRFERVPWQILVTPIMAIVLMGGLALDGQLSRFDGGLLLVGYGVSVLYLFWLNRRGVDIQARSEVGKEFEEARDLGTAKSVGLFLLSLAAIIGGSELLVSGAQDIIARFGLSETAFGMTVLALLVSVEEVARELPAAMSGRPEISYGNVNGSVLTFFLFNAGIISLAHPVNVERQTLWFYLPMALGAIGLVSLFLMTKRISRWAGAVLVLVYVVFAVGGYVPFDASPSQPGRQ